MENDTDVTVLLNELNRQEVINNIPLIIFLVVIFLVGVVGNGLVWYIYKTKYDLSNCRTFVIVLSIVDIFSCIAVIPFEILVVLQQYNFVHAELCQISVFLNTWPTLTAGWLLLAIAVDRFRKVCRSLKWQVSHRAAVKICFVSMGVAFGFSCIPPFIYGIKNDVVQFKSRNVTVSMCAEVREDYLTWLNNIIYAVLFVGVLVVISVMYCFIALGIKKQAKRKMTMTSRQTMCKSIANAKNASEITIFSGKIALSEPHDQSAIRFDEESGGIFCSELSDAKVLENEAKETEIGPCSPVIFNLDDNKTVTQSVENDRKSIIQRLLSLRNISKRTLSSTPSTSTYGGVSLMSRDRSVLASRRRRVHRTAFIMFLITIAFILSYLPLLCILLTRTADANFVPSLSNTERAVYHFFLRSYYLNCAVNPLIYGVWDKRFRKHCSRVIWCLSQRLRH